MRIPSRQTYRQWIRYEMIFCLGMVLGALIFLLFYGKELDRLHLQLKALENENQHYINLNKKHEEQNKSNSPRKLTVENIEIHLEEPKPDDKFIELELQKRIGQEMKFIEGKSLESVNDLHLLIRQHFKERTYRLGDRTVKVELRTITIYQTVHLYLFAKIEQPTP
ncbi:hypothetical protein [Ammoniphilus sp. CFH 90114]|uniref:hypothetical protein n=1 Tax=Ammoniphilus sp. CFH 90114 TaxID=2493665 RepID=UPI00100FDE6E|nr:hypothetical protein [Ammoniphilus sp. CFH 90114]RXT04793.1 hypothetical protein EIZ39_18880 [Ammoniphilus sp. CFH 90114]